VKTGSPLPSNLLGSSMVTRTIHLLQLFVIAGLAVGVYLLLTSGSDEQVAHALPEYSDRTGEACGTCHVNPGGGGPRTLRGLIWAARGRPDQVPQLTGVLLAPNVTDGAELYAFACAGCHGANGEGLFGMRLVGAGISRQAMRSFILQGLPSFGMPAFEGQFDDDQLDAMLDFLTRMAKGEIAPAPDQITLPPPVSNCSVPTAGEQTCGEE
jgi:mono/diheme cytochrome c family protein